MALSCRNSSLRCCLYGGGPALLVELALVRELDFTSRLHGKSQRFYQAGSLSRVTRANYIYLPTKPAESDICVQVFIL